MKAEYINHMGNDLTVVNAARVSFDRESKQDDYILVGRVPDGDDLLPAHRVPILNDADKKLIGYLARHSHWTPFAHPQICLRVTAPIFLANQLKRHQIGFALNEVSRRYVDDEPEFYTPDVWRGRPPGSIKQGSSNEVLPTPEMTDDNGQIWDYSGIIELLKDFYKTAIDEGVAPELARMVLPQSMYTSWYWTGSLAAWARLCKQRLDAHAQKEAQEIAQQISAIIKPLYPVSWAALVEVKA